MTQAHLYADKTKVINKIFKDRNQQKLNLESERENSEFRVVSWWQEKHVCFISWASKKNIGIYTSIPSLCNAGIWCLLEKC